MSPVYDEELIPESLLSASKNAQVRLHPLLHLWESFIHKNVPNK